MTTVLRLVVRNTSKGAEPYNGRCSGIWTLPGLVSVVFLVLGPLPGTDGTQQILIESSESSLRCRGKESLGQRN